MWARPARKLAVADRRPGPRRSRQQHGDQQRQRDRRDRPRRRPRAAATTTASHRLATSIVPCTHQRSGTPSRSSYSGRGSRAEACQCATGRRPVGSRPCPTAPRPPTSRSPVARLDPDLPLPSYAHPGDAGADLVTTVDVTLAPGERALVPTGIALALPDGYVALVHPRSGLAARHGLSIVNTPGTVDAGYRGEIKVLLINHDPREPIELRRGDRIAQLVVQRFERARFVEVDGTPRVGAWRRGLRFYWRLRRPDRTPQHEEESREVPPQVRPEPHADDADDSAEDADEARGRPGGRPTGPFDVDDVADDGVERVDLGSLLIAPERGPRAAAPGRRGSPGRCRRCCSPARTARSSCGPSRRRATATCGARCGRRSPPTWPSAAAPPPSARAASAPSWSASCTVQTQGRAAPPPSRRGSSASTARAGCCAPPSSAGRPSSRTRPPTWEDALTKVVVRRGDHAMPVGDPLPVTLPDQARRSRPPTRLGCGMPGKSRLRRTISRWASSTDQHARDLRRRPTPSTGDARSPTRPTASGCGCAAPCAPSRCGRAAASPPSRPSSYDGSGVHHRRLARPAPDRRHRARPVDRRSQGRIGVARRAPDHVQPALRADPVSRPDPSPEHPDGRRSRPSRRSSAPSSPKALGGRRGMVEAAVPTIAVHGPLADHPRAAARAGRQRRRRRVVLLVVRLVQRSTVQFVVNALFGIGIGWLFVTMSARSRRQRGRPGAGLLPARASSTTPATPCVLAFTCLIGWPLVGFMVGSVTGDPTAWHQDRQVVRLCSPAHLAARRCRASLRVVVQAPIWLAGKSGAMDADTAVAALGVLKIALGWPLQLAALAAMVWLLGRNRTPVGSPSAA